MSPDRHVSSLVLAAVVTAAATSCASEAPAEMAPARAAEAFVLAVASHPDEACRLLAPETRAQLEQTYGTCAQALPDLGVSDAGAVVEADQYGRQARVVFEHDTTFLSRFDGGWRVTAAVCVARGDRPYDCQIEAN